MRIAIAQIDPTVGDLTGNTDRILEAVDRAAREEADLLLLPEMALCGYPARDLLERDDFVEHNLAMLERIAQACTRVNVLVGHIDFNRSGAGRRLHNSASLLGEGRRLATVHKTLLPTYDVFDEARFFEPAPLRQPLDVRGVRVAVTICEDLWAMHGLPEQRPYAIDPLEELLEQGPQLIVNLSASPFSLGKLDERMKVVVQHVRRAGLPLAYCNVVGGNDGVIFDGSSMVFDAEGQQLLRMAPFATDFAVIDLELGASGRSAGASRPQERAQSEAPHAWSLPMLPSTVHPSIPAPVRSAFAAARPSLTPAAGPVPPWQMTQEEQAYRALVLGLRDYVGKTRFRDVAIGLSGGIDSALVAVLAADALGPEHVLGVGMPSAISSDHSRSDARALATNLGIRFSEVPIAAGVNAFGGMLGELFSGLPDDITEENIQARVRGSVLMAVSNKLGHLVLTTGNKSEIAVGYCTLYGDMCGGLAVLGDVAKTLVYRLARWINRDQERIPASTITKPPSAELRPGQLDQDSLPPYDQLDAIIVGYVEQHRPVAELIAAGLPAEIVRHVVRLIDSQEYKRHQAAPVLRITTRAFGTGRRYPVVQRYDPFLDPAAYVPRQGNPA